MTFATQSRDLAKIIGYRAGEARAIRVMGTVATDQGKLEEAISHIEASLLVVKELNDISGVVMA